MSPVLKRGFLPKVGFFRARSICTGMVFAGTRPRRGQLYAAVLTSLLAAGFRVRCFRGIPGPEDPLPQVLPFMPRTQCRRSRLQVSRQATSTRAPQI